MTHMSMARKAVYLMIAAGAAVGCGGRGRGPDIPPELAADSTTILRVENQGFQDVRVYVRPHAGAERIRLGTALGNQTTTLKIPKTVVFASTQLIFEIDPIGGNRPSFSEQITVNPGEEIVLRIPPI